MACEHAGSHSVQYDIVVWPDLQYSTVHECEDQCGIKISRSHSENVCSNMCTFTLLLHFYTINQPCESSNNTATKISGNNYFMNK
jgi:hypothetical protein